MYDQFAWPKAALHRNRLTKRAEPLQPFLFFELARRFRASIFLDVGANAGIYSLFMSQLKRIEEIHAFEAAPNAFELLTKCVKLNGLSNRIFCHEIAISERRGELRFGLAKAHSGSVSGLNSVVETSIHDSDRFVKEITVPAMPLDAVINANGRHICMKIDVDGHEAQVIAGSQGLLRDNSVLLQMEDYRGEEMDSLLASLGYEILFRAGPDLYATNAPSLLSQPVLLEAIQAAVAKQISSNKMHDTPALLESKPIRRDIGNITVEFSGGLALFMRRTKQLILRNHSTE